MSHLKRRGFGHWFGGVHSVRAHRKLVEALTEMMIDGWEECDPLAVAMEATRIEEVLYLLYEFGESSNHHDVLRDSIGERAVDWLRRHGLFHEPGGET